MYFLTRNDEEKLLFTVFLWELNSEKFSVFFSCLGLFLNQLMGKILREHNFHKNNFFLLSSVRDWKMRG